MKHHQVEGCGQTQIIQAETTERAAYIVAETAYEDRFVQLKAEAGMRDVFTVWTRMPGEDTARHMGRLWVSATTHTEEGYKVDLDAIHDGNYSVLGANLWALAIAVTSVATAGACAPIEVKLVGRPIDTDNRVHARRGLIVWEGPLVSWAEAVREAANRPPFPPDGWEPGPYEAGVTTC